MSLEQFMNEAISPWMRDEGPENDIVLSSRVRLARNFADHIFPTIGETGELTKITDLFKEEFHGASFESYKNLNLIYMNGLSDVEKRVLVEKHLISPNLAKAKAGAVLMSENEQVSIMLNEEDHLRMQLYFPGFQLSTALKEAFYIDDRLEQKINYAYDERRGYLTSCPTNVGTGMRASAMVHLPALVFTKGINRMIPAISQLGFVVRGIYGEGTEAVGNMFQVSNQITLGKAEEEIVADLESIITRLVEQERAARRHLFDQNRVVLEDQIHRSYGVLKHSRIMESHEAAKRLSNLRLGIDLGMMEHLNHSMLNELMVLIQPGFLQHYAKGALTSSERDVMRATLIRERLLLEE